ncbi:uncharacterized protein LOC128559482 [Mercenaria mercenaria]|uniref:uncharacterized protein LOC128559482 n=1 Tax=Mercenaria mercenaria TaxID=6596 RepID=UPI00234E676C|nr:uncharacterized protein LOC128559482 [Mercenaria mercenaria]
MEKEKLMLARKLETEKEEAESRRLETEHKFKTDLEKMSKKKVKVKMSPFDEKIDSMDAYLNVYETYAVAQDWDKEIWSLNLPFLLKGTAREVFDRLPLEDRKDYDKLKAALLRQFELTDDGYKKKFRTERPRDNETFVMFLARISRYLDGWLRLSKVDKTYEGLLDFILRDQFLDVCNRELYQNLSSKRLVKAKDVAEDADLFAKTRGGPKYVVNRTNKDRSYKPYEIPQRHYPSSRNVGTSNRGSSNVANRGRGYQPFGVLKCYKCGRIGHSSYYCRSGKYGGNSANAAAELEVEQEQESSKGENRNSKESRNRGRGRDRSRSRGRGRNRDRDRSKSSRSESGNSIIELSDVEELGMLSVSTCPTKPGTCNGRDVIAMRDTGCTCVIVKRDLVEASQFLEKTRRCKYIDGSEHRLDVARIDIDCPYFKGTVEALVVDNPTNDVIIGNVEGAVEPQFSSLASAVETRAQAKVKKQVKLKVPSQILDVSREEFLDKQQKDSTLDLCRKKAEEGTIKQCRGKGSVRFEIRNRLLYREYTAQNLDKSRQLIVPKCLRETVMKVAHDSLLSGHLGIRKTSDRVLGELYWPGVMAEVRRYCQSCSICQRTIAKGRVSKVPLGKMPLIDTPFKRVAVDIVGPIEPMTDRKNRYILTMVDYATRYPEAIALPSIETERVAEALVDMYSRLGVPEEMLTDCGSQFTSELMAEVSRLLSLRQLTTTPYHPMCNGLVEKFNGSLKQMLKRMCSERPRDWDRYLNAMLFAYREVPQESLGFSPFELLYGRTIRGPITVLRELWAGKTENDEVKTTYQYVMDLQEKLEDTCKIAQQQLAKSSARYKKYYNRKARDRRFKAGSKVLVLLPTKHNKLLLHWKGPYVVVEVVNRLDYRIDVDGKLKTFHANMLKQYCERKDDSKSIPDKGILSKVGAAIVEEDQRDYDRLDPNESSDEFSSRVEKDIVLCPIKQGTETYKDDEINPELTVECKQEVVDLLDNFSKVLTDIYFVCILLLILFKFISNVGAIAVPLTDLTKKGQPNLVEWGESQEKAFQTLKASLMGPPILKLPDLDQTFILRVDASDLGLGSVLLQESDGEKLPVAYASRKLLPREQKYSVIEKECLAIVWAVAKFHRYLFGKDFVLETDHQPLTYLNKAKLSNSRLMRWALALQPYRISIRAIPGRENVGADYLSRV